MSSVKINYNSISFKLLLAYVAGVLLSITLMVFISLYLFFYQITSVIGLDVRELARKQSTKLSFNESGYPVGFDVNDQHIAWLYDSLRQEIAYRLLDAGGDTVFTSPAGEDFWNDSNSKWRDSPSYFTFKRDGNEFHAASHTLERAEKTWHLQFAISARFYYLMHKGLALPRMIVGIIVFSIILLFVFGLCAYFSLGYTLRPLRKLSESAAAISPSSIHHRLKVHEVPSEIKPIVNSFNNVLDRLENGYKIQQDFLATAAHELKTPLSLIRAQIESTTHDQKERSLLLLDVEHMTRQVQQLLMLAEVSELQNYKLEYLSVFSVVKEVVDFLDPLACASDVTVAIDQEAATQWLADRAAFFILIKNLLENALQHAPRNTNIIIEVKPSSILLRDFGPGIEENNLDNIFARFWRGAHRRDIGAGLGLAICQEIAQAHNWKISVDNADPGARFIISNVQNE